MRRQRSRRIPPIVGDDRRSRYEVFPGSLRRFRYGYPYWRTPTGRPQSSHHAPDRPHPRRPASGHRRIRRCLTPHGERGWPCGRPHLEPRRRGLRAAHRAQRRARLHPQGRAVGRAAEGVDRMRSLGRALVAIGATGFAAGLVAVALVLTADDSRDVTTFDMLVGPVVGWAFIFAGLVAWWRRPDNRFGSLMTLVGFTWFIGALGLADAPGVFIVGALFGAVPFAVLLHMLLAFPSGRLEGRAARLLIGIGYVAVIALPLLWAPFVQTSDIEECKGCPSNPLLISENEPVGRVLFAIYGLVSIAVLIGVAVLLVQRWRRAPAPERRVLGPLYLTGGATMVLTILVLAVQSSGGEGAARVVNAVAVLLLGSVPFAFLYGLLRTRLAQTGAMREIVTSGRRELRDALATALRDPSLELAYWLPAREVY